MTDLFSEVPLTDEASRREELLNKWKDKPVEDILKAKVEADLFIETITKKQDALSRDYLELKKASDAQASLSDLVDRLNAKAASNSESPPAKEVTEPKPDPIDIDSKVRALIEENKRIERQTNNANLVQSKLMDHYGNSYQDVLRATGLSQKQINEIAAESPEAIFKLVGMDTTKESFQSPPRSNQRQDSFKPKIQKRDWNFYQEMKKTNKNLYLDPKISQQMEKDAAELGEAFFT